MPTDPQITQPVFPGSGGGGGGGGAAPTIVQVGVITTRDGVTLGAAPTQGNLLLAFMSDGGSTNINTAAGWRLLNSISAAHDNAIIAYKMAGAGESATQTPNSNSGAGGAVSVLEIAGGGIVNFADAADIAIANTATLAVQAATGGLIIGAVVAVTAAALPTGLTGAVAVVGGSASGNSRGIELFQQAAPVLGDNTVVATFAAPETGIMILVAVR